MKRGISSRSDDDLGYKTLDDKSLLNVMEWAIKWRKGLPCR